MTRRDRIRNEEIRKVGVTIALDYIKKQQIKWFEHVKLMSPDNIALKALTSRRHYKRRRSLQIVKNTPFPLDTARHRE
jgi:hypothetical protein